MNTDFLYEPFLGTTVFNYLQFVIILLLGILFARVISRYFARFVFTFFKKFSSDTYSQHFIKLLLQPLQGLVITISAYIAFNRIDVVLENIIVLRRTIPATTNATSTERVISLMNVVDHVFFLAMLIYFTLLVSRILDFVFFVLLGKAKDRDDRERQQLLPLLKDVLKVLVWSLAFLAILGVVFNVNVTALIAGLGVGGIAIAFAAKETLENLLASFMVMIDKPFTIGDWIKVDGVEGTVEKVGFRSTRLRTFDKSIITLPNRALIDGQLENFSERGMRRVKFVVGAVYGLSQKTLETIIAEIKKFIVNTQHTTGITSVYLDSFGDSSIDIQIVYYVALEEGSVKFEEVKQNVNFGIYQIMYKYGKGFAFPTQAEVSLEDINEVEKMV